MKSFFIFALALIIFTIGLNGQEIISFDARFYLFALEMWRHGISWFPTTYGVPYADYPVASTVLIYLSALLFGSLNKFTAVLPTAIAAALTVLMTYKIGRLQNSKIGLYAILLLVSTLTFFKSARGIALDMYPTLITACCFYLVYSTTVYNQPQRIKWIYPLLVLSFIFRGPIGLVMPTGVVCVYYLLSRNIKQMLITGITAAFLLSLCTASLLLLAYHAGGSVFLQDVWRMEVMGRMGSQFLPFYFYFTDSIISYALAYPFALAVILGLFYQVLSKRNVTKELQFTLQLTGWVLVIMLGMSVPGDKKVRYILPMAPAIALLAASVFAVAPKQKYMMMLSRLIFTFFLFLPGLLCAATIYAWQVSARFDLVGTVPFLSLIIFFALMQLASIGCYFVNFERSMRSAGVMLGGTVCFVAANLLIIEPIELYVDRTRHFVLSVEVLRAQQQVRLAFYREQSDGLPIKYLVNMPVEEKPIFIVDEAALQAMHEPLIVVTSEDYYQSLSREQQLRDGVISRGRIGHVNVVVFEHEVRHDR
jgi:4-amino-4-deoxy-L-arabinose transferase-like glycosyltransferase